MATVAERNAVFDAVRAELVRREGSLASLIPAEVLLACVDVALHTFEKVREKTA